MASVVCAPRNETTRLTTNHHPSRSAAGFMGKIPPFLNTTNPNNPNPNPNPNHKFSRKQFPHQNGDNPNPNPTASDDASSFSHHRQPDVATSFSHYVSFDISSYSRSELRSLKTRLMSELDRVRTLSTRIESGPTNPNPKKRPMPFQNPTKDSKRFASCSNGKANQQQQPVYMATGQLMKMCVQVLTKLMKQKAGYIFNSPVDVVGLGLHDYHQIIKEPMDLGTIKTNLGKNLYPTPEEFAADVRLTFNNALLYNPKGHEVHSLAEQFLARFEQLYRPVYQKYMSEKQQQMRNHHQQRPENRPKEDVVVVDEVVQGSCWTKNNNSNNPSPEIIPKMMNPNPNPIPPKKQVVEMPKIEPPQPPRPDPAPAPPPAPVAEVVPPVKGQIGRGPSGKLPKPKAKDPNKREMTMEEKHKLGAGLQSLPEEKMTQVIQIIGKRSGGLAHNGDEIELDIEAVDTETLWELDRFVTNYKKMVSKIRRAALIPSNSNVGQPEANQASASERMVDTGNKARKGGGGGDVGEEDVDIGDEMPVNNFPPLEIEKDDDRQQQQQNQGGASSSSSSSSSSSGSDSSSSSDSDSGSSSGSDSDVDDAQSRDNESKNVHH